ncbi:MAG: HAMP domain-containing histidine kinase [Clostridia bacterium]|nr:HAMP domain-containing histidine kinase [Clostridia bacterium]
MFNKSKRKIVFAIVFSLLALMTITLVTIYVSNLLTIQKENEEMLRTFTERYSLEAQPNLPVGDKPEGDIGVPTDAPPVPRDDGKNGRNEPAFRLSTFYSVAYSKSGEVLAINNGDNDLQSEEKLLEIASTAMAKTKNSGRIGNLSYLVTDRGDYTLVAMIDGTINDNNQRKLLWLMMGIGGGALVVLAVLSVFIARKIVSPMEENDKRQKRFVSDAGHELKTPIAVISTNSELLKREIGNNEWLANIDYENERMSELVQQLLSLSRAEAGELPKERLDLSQLVTGETLPFESIAFEKGKTLESFVTEGLHISGNANQLRQLVSILLDNALSHGVDENVTLSLTLEKRSIVLSVSNGANEISEEQISHLFDRFYRADESRAQSGSHYGLGLSIAKAIAESHGGNIRAEYREGKITFIVTFPNKN